MLSLSDVALLEKNKISSDGVWLILLEVILSETDNIRLVANNEDIVWNGNTYIAFPFDIGKVSENAKGESTNLEIRICNVDNQVLGHVAAVKGGAGSEVVLRVVHSKHLDLTTPELEERFIVEDTRYNEQNVTFVLGTEFSLKRTFPRLTYQKDSCPFKYKSIECGATSSQTACDGTLKQCRERNNSIRFGGEPGLLAGGSRV